MAKRRFKLKVDDWSFRSSFDLKFEFEHPLLPDLPSRISQSSLFLNCSNVSDGYFTIPKEAEKFLMNGSPCDWFDTPLEFFPVTERLSQFSDPQHLGHFLSDLETTEEMVLLDNYRVCTDPKDEKFEEVTAGILYDLCLTNSFNALASFCKTGMYEKNIDYHDPFIKKAIEFAGRGTLEKHRNDDYLSQNPCKFYNVPTSFIVAKGAIKISEYHEGKIEEAIKLFPKNKIAIEFEYEHVEINKEIEDGSLMLRGFAEMEPNAINVDVKSD